MIKQELREDDNLKTIFLQGSAWSTPDRQKNSCKMESVVKNIEDDTYCFEGNFNIYQLRDLMKEIEIERN